MPFLSGTNYTIDVVLDKGKIVAYYGMESKPGKSGTFEYQTIYYLKIDREIYSFLYYKN